MVEARKERNTSRRRRRGQKRPQPISADESDALPGALQPDEIEAMHLLPGASVLSHTRLPISTTVVSSLPRSDTPLQSDSTSILARLVPYDGVSGLVPYDNLFWQSGGHDTSSSRDAGGGGVSAPPSGAAPLMETQVGNSTEILLTPEYEGTFLTYRSLYCLQGQERTSGRRGSRRGEIEMPLRRSS